MIDPFSLLQVSETAGSVAHKLSQIIKQLAEAPEEILALSNELWNLQIVLEDWREIQRRSIGHATELKSKQDAGAALLFQARVKLDELNNLVNQWGKPSQWGDSWNMGRRDRFLWLRERKRVAGLQATLRELRTNIIATTGIQTSAAVTRLEMDVRHLFEQYVALHDATVTASQESSSLTQAFQGSSQTLQNIHRNQSESKDILLNMLAAMEKMNIDKQVDRRFDDYIEQSSPPPYRLNSSRLPNTPLTDNAITKSGQPISDQSVFSMAIRAKLKNASSCAPTCSCHCHSKTNLQTPQLLQRLTGRLFLGYTGKFYFRSKCLPGCSQSDSTAFTMTYFFPKWFFERAISLSLSEGLLGTPNLNIKIRRLVPEMSQIFAMSRYGDVEGLKTLFVQRHASPDDVHIRGGWTALHFAVDHGSIEACKLLLECGADPEWEDATGTTPVEIAWRNILHLRAPAKTSETFSVLFPGTEFLQERRFSRLHRLVIGLDAGDLEKELQLAPQSVHTADIDGWTPLHWAARRGNYHTLTQLLTHGADPLRVTENESRNALHLAAQGNSAACVQHLLQYRRGNTIVDIEGKDGYGNTALRTSAGYNCAAATARLIQLGADLNATDNFGEPPLLSAVYENAHETITLLLNAGADYTLKTKFGNTILHFAANESDPETLSLLTRTRMRGVDSTAKNVDGLSANDLAAARARCPPDFLVLFDRLLASVDDDDDYFEAQSMMTSTTWGTGSWKSLEDSIWFDAEQGANEDIWEKKQEQNWKSPCGSPTLADPSIDCENVQVEDYAEMDEQPEDMV